MIQLASVSLILDGKTILDEISWTIHPGEHWILYGRNGSGKSKLLQCITGYLHPSSGSITRFGKTQPGYDIRELRRRIGYLGNSLKERFNPGEPILAVVLSGIFSTIGLYDEAGEAGILRARELLGAIGLEERSHEGFARFSDGEKQKILLARAFIANPPLLVLDEAASNLDLAYREEFLSSLASLMTASSSTVIYVTHHTEEIIEPFQKICILDRGRTLFQGTLDEGITGERLSLLYNRTIKVEKQRGRYLTRVE